MLCSVPRWLRQAPRGSDRSTRAAVSGSPAVPIARGARRLQQKSREASGERVNAGFTHTDAPCLCFQKISFSAQWRGMTDGTTPPARAELMSEGLADRSWGGLCNAAKEGGGSGLRSCEVSAALRTGGSFLWHRANPPCPGTRGRRRGDVTPGMELPGWVDVSRCRCWSTQGIWAGCSGKDGNIQ